MSQWEKSLKENESESVKKLADEDLNDVTGGEFMFISQPQGACQYNETDKCNRNPYTCISDSNSKKNCPYGKGIGIEHL